MDKYFFLALIPLGVGLVPLALFFALGLIVDDIPGRNKHWWPQSRGFQFMDQLFQDCHMGRAGVLLTEFINGLAHGSFAYGWAVSIAPVSQWRWQIAIAMFAVFFVILGVKRVVHYVPR